MQFYESSRFFFLWLLLLLGLIFWWGSTEHKRRLSRIGEVSFLLRRLMPGFSYGRKKLGWIFFILAFFLSTLALARPQWGEEKRKVERKGVDLIFLLDTSLSMLAEDVKPNRLDKSKLEIKSLIRRLKGDRVGMVAFAGSSFLQCPLTLDYSAFLLFVDSLKPGYIPNPGTSLSQAIGLAVRAFPDQTLKYKAALIFSDGEDHEGGVEEGLEEAKKTGVRIYTMGVGTPEGDPIPLRSAADGKISGYKKDRRGEVVVTRLNTELLEKIAKETGGLYLPATAGEKEIDVILKHLETLGEKRLKEKLVSAREDHFQIFLMLALFFLLWEMLLGYEHQQVSKGAPFVLPILAFFLFSGFLNSPYSLVEEGNHLAENKKYQSAVEKYRKAEISKPDEPIIRYNLGTSLYQLYQYRDAEKELDQALSQAKDPLVKSKILYNDGNAKYRLGDFDKAVEAYKKVLDLNPKDEDAKYNLEFLQKKKAQFEKKNQERQQEKQKQKNQPNPQKNQGEQRQPQPSPQQQGQQNQNQPQGGQENQQKVGAGESQNQQERKEEEQGQQGGQQQKENQGQEEKGQKQEKEQQQNPEESSQQAQEQEKQQGQEKRETQQQENQKEQEQATTGYQEKGAEKAPSPMEQQGGQPLQGQMSQENALRILEALREGEKKLQDLRRPPTHPDSQEVEKDW